MDITGSSLRKEKRMEERGVWSGRVDLDDPDLRDQSLFLNKSILFLYNYLRNSPLEISSTVCSLEVHSITCLRCLGDSAFTTQVSNISLWNQT